MESNIVEFRFFKVKPKHVYDTPDHIQEFDTLAEAKVWWFENDYLVMHMVNDENGSQWSTSYVKSNEE